MSCEMDHCSHVVDYYIHSFWIIRDRYPGLARLIRMKVRLYCALCGEVP